MKTLSLRMDQSIFDETEKILARINKTRNRYINEAIDHYNQLLKRQLLAKTLEKESRLVRKESLNILKDFEKTGYAD